MSKTLEYFLQYVKIDTQSEEDSTAMPSTGKQHVLAGLLVEQLTAMGCDEITYDKEHCYVYASVPASEGCEDGPVLGFVAHMDTAPVVSGAQVVPRVITGYDGQDIVLKVSDFPEIRNFTGQDLVVTDGTTLLGADDKAGIAEIMAMAEYLLSHREVKHGKIRIGFTPDEEIGRGADHFDVKLFGADFAYTVDGGTFGGLEEETFNAAAARITVRGRSVHPGSAKGRMINAILVAQEFQGLLPVFDNPMYTEGYEGFFHLDRIQGDVENTVAEYIIRDHSMERFNQKKEIFRQCAAFLNQRYGEGCVTVDMTDSYYNMKEVLKDHGHLIRNASRIIRELGTEPKVTPVRGGTDGSRLSFMGLPCPNLCTGGENYHSRFEYACVQSMEKVTKLLVGLCARYAEKDALLS